MTEVHVADDVFLKLTPRELSLPGRTIPPALPLVISCQDRWNRDSCKLVTKEVESHSCALKVVDDAVELLCTIEKPLAVLSICGPYRSGKSYFLSRLLGNPGAFRMGHGMRACTRGIWLATTVLECEQFAAIFLDTEGIDAIGASETMAMCFLSLTTLLSSYLIYNSKKVPHMVDLDKLRCCSQLSTSLLAQRGCSISSEAIQKFMPHFLWLLRDVSLSVTNRKGEPITPTEFLHTCVLATESGQPTDLGKYLFGFFPSLKCHTLPIPSVRPAVIRNIIQQQDKLRPAFNTAIEQLNQQILQQLVPKKARDGVTLLNGHTFAALAHEYVGAVNTPGAIPDLEQGWQAFIKLQLKEFSDSLVREYEKQMEISVKDNLPMDDSSLMMVHEQKLMQVKKLLELEVHRISPLMSRGGEMEKHLKQLELKIIRRNDDCDTKVVGGALFQFIARNYSESKQRCEECFREAMKLSKVQEKCSEAIQTSKPLDIGSETDEIIQNYRRTAVGPASSEVLDKGMVELNQLRDTIKMIPGKVTKVQVIGTGPDRVKLRWEPPKHNPEAVETYIVWKQAKDGPWEEATKTKRTTSLVMGLKPQREYKFKVVATNSLIMGLDGRIGHSGTMMSRVQNAACVAGFGGMLSLLLVGGSLYIHAKGKETEKDMKYWLGFSAAGLVTLPINILLLPVTIPTCLMPVAIASSEKQSSGDLTPEEAD